MVTFELSPALVEKCNGELSCLGRLFAEESRCALSCESRTREPRIVCSMKPDVIWLRDPNRPN